MATLLVMWCTAAVLALLAHWGRHNADSLVVTTANEEDRAHRVAVLRRGGLFCYVVALMLMALGVLGLA